MLSVSCERNIETINLNSVARSADETLTIGKLLGHILIYGFQRAIDRIFYDL